MTVMLNDEEKDKLVKEAREAQAWAYAPYSGYKVGAALMAASGKVYTGINVENAAYPAGMCAERVAVFKAISEGENEFTAIAVVTRNAGSPCGICRQVLAEFGLDTQIILANEQGAIKEETSVAGMLPNAFTPSSLQQE
jgi:cytidine deaminase